MIHRFWLGEPRPLHRWTAAANQHIGRPKDWTPQTVPMNAFLAMLDAVDAVTIDDLPRHCANIARWSLLHRFGGVWLDNDVIILADHLPDAPWCAAIGTSLTSCAVGLPAEHPLASDMLEAVRAASPSNRRAPAVSGDHVLNKLAPNYDLMTLQLSHDSEGVRRGGPILHLWETSGLQYARSDIRSNP